MEIATVQTGDRPKLQVKNVRGNLRIRPGEPGQVEARGPDGSKLKLVEQDGGAVLTADSDCQLLVPPEAVIEAKSVGGDLSVLDVSGELLIRNVGGAARLRRAGAVVIETIGGDLVARMLAGKLSVDNVGGDALVDQVDGELYLRNVGADLRLSRVSGAVHATAGGDGKLSLEPAPGVSSSISVGGDLSCYVPEQASVYLKLSAGGDYRLAVPVQAEDVADGCEVRLGQAEAEVSLAAGGDLIVRAGQADDQAVVADLGEAIAMRVGAEIETHMAEIEERLSGFGDRLQSFDSDRIGRKIRSSIARAQRKAARAQRRAAQRRDFRVEVPSAARRAQPSDEERLMILRMVEQGKLSVDEAESLLEALEG